jgi:transposase
LVDTRDELKEAEMSKMEGKQTRERRSFTKEFKAGAVKLVLVEGRKASQVARDLDLTRSALDGWVRQAKADRGQGKPGALTTEEREELSRLRKENRQLQMERELLKKWAAFFARENA